ncbi:MAG: pyridoxal-phosphate dependent enzyme [Patescibacteria group bacterium]|nr:pyridoxal-phosphate dependent enzyme [Patescibacteria group bacterium]
MFQNFESSNVLRCMECGFETGLLKERKFRCPDCSGLYDVVHPQPAGQNWNALRRIFDARARIAAFHFSGTPEQRSGIWRFKELVMPGIPDESIVTLGEGNVPIIPAGRHLRSWVGGNIDLWLMLQGVNPTGAFKDHGGTVMISVAKLARVPLVACSSTGDTSAMLSAYAAAAGIPCVVILPAGLVTPVQLAQPLVHGAKVITLPGNFDACMRVMQTLVADYGVYPANSLNPARIEGHQATVFLIAQYFGWRLPDWIVAPVGNGSNVSSIGKGLRCLEEQHFPAGSRILGCQSAAADPLARSWSAVNMKGDVVEEEWEKDYHPIKPGITAATAARIGAPVSWRKVIREVVASRGAMETASEADLNEAVAVCGNDGHFVCPQTGTALAGLRNAVRVGVVKNGRVVVVSTATGLKFTESAVSGLLSQIQQSPDCNTGTVARLLAL